MSMKKNVFISHHHKDDALVDKMTNLLSKNGCEIRNSSIRAKPANQERLDKGLVKEKTIERLLRMKMSWAGTVIVLVGKETHTRPWVNWEIKEAQRQGKNIVGVYEQGLKDKVELPEALKNYGTSWVGWNAESIINAVNGNSIFQNPDGSPSSRQDGYHPVC
ncbi:MAG: TIR domain-containing protein [Sulfuricellaceae bacterium]|nr:TIR domain-containing protein [Sulfuricellaceae bacterium]